MAKARAISVNKSEEDRWRAESDMHTLAEAEKIKRDPKRLKAAVACANDKMKQVAAVAGMDTAKT